MAEPMPFRAVAGLLTEAGPIVVELTADGLVKACSWCTPMVQLKALSRVHRVTHTLCQACSDRILESLL